MLLLPVEPSKEGKSPGGHFLDLRLEEGQSVCLVAKETLLGHPYVWHLTVGLGVSEPQSALVV